MIDRVLKSGLMFAMMQGNAAFSAGNFEQAVEAFDAAIAVDPTNHILYSNKAAALTSLNKF